MTDVGLQMGLAMGAASMLSVGPNNLLLLRSGLCGRSPVPAVSAILGSYVLLVVMATVMAGSAVTVNEATERLLKWAGLVALANFAVMSFRSGLSAKRQGRGKEVDAVGLGTVLRTVWLNPLTFVELFLIPLSLAKSMTEDFDRMAFAAALLAMSALCCLGYAYGGVAVSRLLGATRLLASFDLVSGLILGGMSISLACGLLGMGV